MFFSYVHIYKTFWVKKNWVKWLPHWKLILIDALKRPFFDFPSYFVIRNGSLPKMTKKNIKIIIKYYMLKCLPTELCSGTFSKYHIFYFEIINNNNNTLFYPKTIQQ